MHKKLLFVLVPLVSLSASTANLTPEQELIQAVILKDKKRIENLLKDPNLDTNAQDASGYTGLTYAIQQNDIEIVKLFLDHEKLNISKHNLENNINIILLSMHKGYNKILELLVAHPTANVNQSGYYGSTALHLAVGQNNITKVAILCRSKKINVALVNNNKDSPFHIAVYQGYDAIFELLLKHATAQPNQPDSSGNRALHIAAYKGNIKMITSLLNKKGIKVNLVNQSQDTPLHIATYQGHIKIVKALLPYATESLNLADSKGNTPLHTAVSRGHAKIVDILLAQPTIKVNSTNKNGETALHIAIRLQRLDICKKLLQHGSINLNIPNTKTGQTPLIYATQHSLIKCMRKLLGQKNLQIHAKDHRGKTAFDYATTRKAKKLLGIDGTYFKRKRRKPSKETPKETNLDTRELDPSTLSDRATDDKTREKNSKGHTFKVSFITTGILGVFSGITSLLKNSSKKKVKKSTLASKKQSSSSQQKQVSRVGS